MVHHSLPVCMDDTLSDWFQGTIHEEGAMDSSSSPSPIVDILARPTGIMERRLRPPQDLTLKCPRCDSTNTKFCYYNNYSLTQPRYFCKTCRRYWTKGGTLRNIPVGGGCRKNKKVVTKKSGDKHATSPSSLSPTSSSFAHGPGTTDLQLSSGLHIPVEMQFSYLMGDHSGNPGIMGGRLYNGMIEFMDSKYENLVEGSGSRSYDFMGNGGDHMGMGLIGGMNHNGMGLGSNFHAPPFGMAYDDNVINGPNSFMETNTTSQRLLLPPNYNNNPSDHDNNQLVEVKPNPKILALGWQDQGCFDAGKDSYGSSYINGMGSWPGLMNGYGSSTSTNPMV